MQKLKDLFNIKEKDIISITGAGGKTTLMFTLANELKNYGSVLVTTSTKIAIPDAGFDKIYISSDDYQKPEPGQIVVLGEKVLGKEKLGFIGYEKLNEIRKDFDFTIIEADGCRNMPVKFWKDHEPVICDFTDKTIGILSIKTYGKVPDKEFIYNYDGFVEFCGKNVIDYKTFNRLISYDMGLFKNFNKECIVFFNQVEEDNDFKNINEIIANKEFTYPLYYGSLIRKDYYEN